MSESETPHPRRDQRPPTIAGVDQPGVETTVVGNLYIVSYPDGASADRYIAANALLGNQPLLRQVAQEARVVVVYDLAAQINATAPPGFRVAPAEILREAPR